MQFLSDWVYVEDKRLSHEECSVRIVALLDRRLPPIEGTIVPKDRLDGIYRSRREKSSLRDASGLAPHQGATIDNLVLPPTAQLFGIPNLIVRYTTHILWAWSIWHQPLRTLSKMKPSHIRFPVSHRLSLVDGPSSQSPVRRGCALPVGLQTL